MYICEDWSKLFPLPEKDQKNPVLMSFSREGKRVSQLQLRIQLGLWASFLRRCLQHCCFIHLCHCIRRGQWRDHWARQRPFSSGCRQMQEMTSFHSGGQKSVSAIEGKKRTCDVGKVQTWVLFLNAALNLPPCFTAARLLAATLYFVFSTGRLLLLLSPFSLWAGCTLMAWLCVERATAEHYPGGYRGFMILRCW